MDALRSAVAAGMEQGLREMPMVLQSMSCEARQVAAQALASAIRLYYPDFLAKDARRLTKVKARGSIRGESEFHLVRHQIDLLEGEQDSVHELRELYALLADFEGRRS